MNGRLSGGTDAIVARLTAAVFAKRNVPPIYTWARHAQLVKIQGHTTDAEEMGYSYTDTNKKWGHPMHGESHPYDAND